MHDIRRVYSTACPAERVLLFSAHAVWRSPAPCAGPRVLVLSVIIRPTHDSATSKQTNITSSPTISRSPSLSPSSSFTCVHVKFLFLQYLHGVFFSSELPYFSIFKPPHTQTATLTHFPFHTISFFHFPHLSFPLSIYFALCSLYCSVGGMTKVLNHSMIYVDILLFSQATLVAISDQLLVNLKI